VGFCGVRGWGGPRQSTGVGGESLTCCLLQCSCLGFRVFITQGTSSYAATNSGTASSSIFLLWQQRGARGCQREWGVGSSVGWRWLWFHCLPCPSAAQGLAIRHPPTTNPHASLLQAFGILGTSAAVGKGDQGRRGSRLELCITGMAVFVLGGRAGWRGVHSVHELSPMNDLMNPWCQRYCPTSKKPGALMRGKCLLSASLAATHPPTTNPHASQLQAFGIPGTSAVLNTHMSSGPGVGVVYHWHFVYILSEGDGFSSAPLVLVVSPVMIVLVPPAFPLLAVPFALCAAAAVQRCSTLIMCGISSDPPLHGSLLLQAIRHVQCSTLQTGWGRPCCRHAMLN